MRPAFDGIFPTAAHYPTNKTKVAEAPIERKTCGTPQVFF